MRHSKGRILTGVAVTMTLAVLGAVAYACVPQASLNLTPKEAAAGTKITISGSSFDATGSAVKVWWDGAGKTVVGEFPVTAGRTFTATFEVPASAAGGAHVVSATQNDANGRSIAGSPVNAMFTVTGAAPPAAAPAVVQVEPERTVTEPAPAVAAAEQPAAAPAPAATPAPAPRVRVAPTGTAVRAPVAAAAPAPAAPAPAPEAAPAPAPAVAQPAPATEPTPAPAPARRSVMVSMASDSDGSPALAIALVGIGLVLALGASAVVLAGRRDRKAPASARR